MSSSTVSFTWSPNSSNLTCFCRRFLPIRTTPNSSLKIKATLLDFPLASRIMVRNLSYSTRECSLQKEFSKFGQIAEVKLVEDGATKRSKGYAFIQYTCQDDAMLALENMDYKYFDGRLIYVELAKPGKNALGGSPKTSGPPGANGQWSSICISKIKQ